jgi:hypothetical protein
MNNFREGQIYIVSRIKKLKDTWEISNDLKKIEILEISKLTIKYKNLDSPGDTGTRMLIKDFNDIFKIVEIIEDPLQNFINDGKVS